ncbi:MAG: hypothetical protein GVY18_01495 [Bacteroidetes bacterium]|jgi:hypothetical protein|nr:hypothetical protein [Bacteroidota bacterium]
MEPSVSPTPAATLDHLSTKAQAMAPWLKALGVANIVIGVPSAVALVGVVYIWLGVVLYQAGERATTASGADLVALMDKLRTYFLVMTILTILGVVLALGYLLIIGVVVMGLTDALSF